MHNLAYWYSRSVNSEHLVSCLNRRMEGQAERQTNRHSIHTVVLSQFVLALFFLSKCKLKAVRSPANTMLNSTPLFGKNIKLPSTHIDCSEMSHEVMLCIRDANTLCCRVHSKLLSVWGKHLGPHSIQFAWYTLQHINYIKVKQIRLF